MAITLRSVKGSPLTHNEVDANFTTVLSDYQDYFYSFIDESISTFTPDALYHKYVLFNFQSPLTIEMPTNTPEIGSILVLNFDTGVQKTLSWNVGYDTSLVTLPTTIDKITEVSFLYDTSWFVIGVA